MLRARQSPRSKYFLRGLLANRITIWVFWLKVINCQHLPTRNAKAESAMPKRKWIESGPVVCSPWRMAPRAPSKMFSFGAPLRIPPPRLLPCLTKRWPLGLRRRWACTLLVAQGSEIGVWCVRDSRIGCVCVCVSLSCRFEIKTSKLLVGNN